MSKIKVVQQVLDPTGSGGVSAEYRALQHSALLDDYCFVPMVLMNPHRGINFKDISFYYHFLKENPGDIIHIRGVAPDGLNAVIAAKLAGKGKILVTVHGMYSDLVYISPVKRWISYHIIENLTFRLADGISCVCKAANERMRFRKYRRKMLPYVYNRMPDYSALDKTRIRLQIRQELGLTDDMLVGVYVGRVTREKGLDHLVQALKEVPENCRVLVVGDGAYLKEMRALCGENVIFLGEQRDVYRFLFAGDFFIQPSLHENHSIALLEAAGSGLPMIATDVGGNREIVENNVNGILIPRANPDRLKDAICTFCNRFQTTQRQYLTYPQFSAASVDRSLQEVYQLLLRREA